MQNDVLTRTVERSLTASFEGRRQTYENEVRALVEAGLAVMRRTGRIDPRVADIVEEAGLSNQAFYRHFESKDELLLAIMAEGRSELLTFLDRKMAAESDPAAKVRRWVEGVMAQATNRKAADLTRPFAVNAPRLAHAFPEETAASADILKAPLEGAIHSLGAVDPVRDADAVYHLVIGCMERHLALGTTPRPDDIEHLVGFVLRGVDRSTDAP